MGNRETACFYSPLYLLPDTGKKGIQQFDYTLVRFDGIIFAAQGCPVPRGIIRANDISA